MKKKPSKLDIFCLPCLPLMAFLSRRDSKARERRSALRELPIKGRELTLRLEHEVDDGLRVAGSQPQSKLMALPLEIRRRIYKECVGGHKISLDVLAGSYMQIENRHRGLLCLAFICRQVYSESINILYEENEFVVYMGPHPLSLSRVLPPRRLQHFRDLTIFWWLGGFPSHGGEAEQQWVATWENLRAFTGTKMLRVQMLDAAHWPSDWIFQANLIQENIKATMRSPIFEMRETVPSGRQIVVLSPGVQASGGSQVLGVD